MLTVNQIHPAILATVDNIKTINSANDIENIFQANNIHLIEPDAQLSDIFAKTIDPVIKSHNDFNAGISQLAVQGTEVKSFAPEEMLALQMASQQFSGNITVLSKVISLAIKFINEMTHLQ